MKGLSFVNVKCLNCFRTFDISNIEENALTSHMKDKKHCEQAPSVSPSQSIYFSESESTDLSASEGSNNLSVHRTSSISKSSLDSMIVLL